jgi:hypothetical protein
MRVARSLSSVAASATASLNRTNKVACHAGGRQQKDQGYGIELLHELNCTTNEEDLQVTSVQRLGERLGWQVRPVNFMAPF